MCGAATSRLLPYRYPYNLTQHDSTARVVVDRKGKTMRIISASKAQKSIVHATLVVAQVEALKEDAAWQATLASLPKGVMVK
jgi:membrane carboxypeptidase/penicillin-binding protein PbpC